MPESDDLMSRKTNGGLSGRAKRLAKQAGIPHTAALTSLRTPRAADRTPRRRAAATGLPGLDQLLGPLKPGTLTLLAGRTMAGSTALLLTIARHNARSGLSVMLAELQSTQTETGRMLLAAEASQDLGPTAAHPADPARLAAVATRLRRLPLRLTVPGADALGRLSAEAIRSRAGLLLLDDLGLASDFQQPAPPGAVAGALARLARDLAVPVIATAHLGPPRGLTPDPADLRDPHALQHADRVVLLDRPARLDPPVGQPDLVDLHVTGADGASLGRTSVRFEPESHRMTAAS
ncbi:DnaB-like helicase C-terminal domain-containing protein [Streptomyces bullii]|uniref:DnaB-like helicase C-terminal domain-containing protein n=1 Tax=Streptomyces bullii TaxID=349910 RepID=A0ABW0V396_9ACTN